MIRTLWRGCTKMVAFKPWLAQELTYVEKIFFSFLFFFLLSFLLSGAVSRRIIVVQCATNSCPECEK
eukprot:m.113209 g.113209  ORF g.113209 m.113209 type:complete len:67 (+) comp13503_c0_seq11:3081-3281(+)